MRDLAVCPSPGTPSLDLDLSMVESVALRRLIEEVREVARPDSPEATLYNRTYHRHNR